MGTLVLKCKLKLALTTSSVEGSGLGQGFIKKHFLLFIPMSVRIFCAHQNYEIKNIWLLTINQFERKIDLMSILLRHGFSGALMEL